MFARITCRPLAGVDRSEQVLIAAAAPPALPAAPRGAGRGGGAKKRAGGKAQARA